MIGEWVFSSSELKHSNPTAQQWSVTPTLLHSKMSRCGNLEPVLSTWFDFSMDNELRPLWNVESNYLAILPLHIVNNISYMRGMTDGLRSPSQRASNAERWTTNLMKSATVSNDNLSDTPWEKQTDKPTDRETKELFRICQITIPIFDKKSQW